MLGRGAAGTGNNLFDDVPEQVPGQEQRRRPNARTEQLTFPSADDSS